MGLAGVVPYLATSLSTVVLSFDIQYAANHGTGFFMSGEVSEQLLHIIEPLQLGYGATVCLCPPNYVRVEEFACSITFSMFCSVPFSIPPNLI